MLSPDSPITRWVLACVLAALLALLVIRAVRKNRRQFRSFTELEDTADRQRMFRAWLIEAFVTFGGSATIILILAWRYVGMLLSAVRDWEIGRWFSGIVGTSWLVPGIATGLAVLIVGGTVLAVYAARNTEDIPTIGDIGALLPRNRPELRYGLALSINAGLVEELLFRLAVPALAYAVIGNALVAVIVSVLLFGALHAYQGLPGMIASTLIGAILMVLYLATGTIIVPIVAHALFDLRSLVLIPVVVYRVQRKD